MPVSSGEDYFDTNVVPNLSSADTAKADRTEELLAIGRTISVHGLNDLVAVAPRGLRMSSIEIREVLAQIQCSLCGRAGNHRDARSGRANCRALRLVNLRCLDRLGGLACGLQDTSFGRLEVQQSHRATADDLQSIRGVLNRPWFNVASARRVTIHRPAALQRQFRPRECG
jgi:hypothetical protein